MVTKHYQHYFVSKHFHVGHLVWLCMTKFEWRQTLWSTIVKHFVHSNMFASVLVFGYSVQNMAWSCLVTRNFWLDRAPIQVQQQGAFLLLNFPREEIQNNPCYILQCPPPPPPPKKYKFSNYWMRLSRIWRILQIKEGVIHRGPRPRWITPSKICRILHILRKRNSTIALLFIQNISSFLKEFRHYALCFSAQPCPQVFSVNHSIISGGLYFWRHWFNMAKILTSLVQ